MTLGRVRCLGACERMAGEMEREMAKQFAPEAAIPAVERGPGTRGLRLLARPALRVLLVLVLAVALMECISFVSQALAYPKVGYDFSIYFAAALALRDNPHANVYSLQVLQASAVAHHAAIPQALYLYPPFLAICLIPLTLLPYGAALDAWLMFCLICWLLGAVALAAQLRALLVHRNGSAPPTQQPAMIGSPPLPFRAPIRRLLSLTDGEIFAVAVGLSLALAYGPLMQSFQLGQVTSPIFAVVACLPFLLRHEKFRSCGVLVGLAALLKLSPGLLILYFALEGRRRVATAALATVAIAAVAPFPLVGLDGLFGATRMLINDGTNAQQFHNQSLARVPLWLTAATGGGPSHVADLLGYAMIALVVVTFISGMFYMRRGASRLDVTPDAASHREMLGYAWALATMLLVSPIVWEHYDAWLLPAVIVCLGYGIILLSLPRQSSAIRLAGALCVAVALISYALTVNALPFSYDGLSAFSPGPYIAGHPIRPYFMLFRPLASFLLWLVTGLLLLRGIPVFARIPAASPSSGNNADGERPTLSPQAPMSTGLLLRTVLALLASVIFANVAVGVVTSLAHASGGP